MELSIARLATMAGVSSRTLRHYDAIGLLKPARTGHNGYRWYDRQNLRRLQRILLLRELGVSLDHIAAIIDGSTDEREGLEQHREDLLTERARLDRLLATIERSLAALAHEADMQDEDFFDGFVSRRVALQADLRARHGDDIDAHFDEADSRTASWTRDDHQRAAREGRELLGHLSRLRRHGHAVTAPAVLDTMAEHHAGVVAIWPADPAAYAALADLVIAQPDQRQMVAAVDPDLPEWLAEAIRAYARERLGLDT